MYYSHNLHFLAFASCMNGNFSEAKGAAARLVVNAAPGVKAMPMLEGFLPTPFIVLAAFERWNDILNLRPPDSSLSITSAVWHAMRGVAFANLGKTAEAEKEQQAFRDLAAKIPLETMYDQLNRTEAVFRDSRKFPCSHDCAQPQGRQSVYRVVKASCRRRGRASK
jgi:hypothetical protein